jgi:hypothetical protein
MNKQKAAFRIQLWWRIIKTCNQYFINQEKTPFCQEAEDEWRQEWAKSNCPYDDISDPMHIRHPLKRDYLLKVNESFTASCRDCCKKFRFCPDTVFYYTRKFRADYKKIACGYCKSCFEIRLFSYLNYFNSWPCLRFNGSEFHLGNKFVHENFRYKVHDLAKKVIVPTVYRCNYYKFHRFKGNRIEAYCRPQGPDASASASASTGITFGFHDNNVCDFGGITRK